MAPKSAAQRIVASKLLAQLKTGTTLRGLTLTAEQKRDYIDQLEKYAETLTLPASKASILNQIRGFKHQLECDEIETAQKQLTANAQAATHALACAIGAAQSAHAEMQNVVEISKEQSQRVADHKAGDQASSENIGKHADQAASSIENQVEDAVDAAVQDAVGGVVKLFYKAEEQTKRKHEHEVQKLNEQHEKKLKIISMGKRATILEEVDAKIWEEENREEENWEEGNCEEENWEEENWEEENCEEENWFEGNCEEGNCKEENSEAVKAEKEFQDSLNETVEDALMSLEDKKNDEEMSGEYKKNDEDEKQDSLEKVWLAVLQGDQTKSFSYFRQSKIEALEASQKEREKTLA